MSFKTDCLAAPLDVSQAVVLLKKLFSDLPEDQPYALFAELLVADQVGCPRLELFLHRDVQLSGAACSILAEQAERILRGAPLQYVLGYTEFMGRRFLVDERVLIPRPETEVLVSTMLSMEALWRGREPVVIDVGTGSGAILLSLAAEQNGTFTGCDVSLDALEVAQINAARLGLAEKVSFRHASLLEGFEAETADVVVSNPPYITRGECEELPKEIRDFEPRTALDGGADGLDAYRGLIPQAAGVLRPSGRLFLEIGEKQAGPVADLAEKYGFVDIRVLRDLAGRERIITAEVS